MARADYIAVPVAVIGGQPARAAHISVPAPVFQQSLEELKNPGLILIK